MNEKQEGTRVCPECGQTGFGPFCHHWDAGWGERKIATEERVERADLEHSFEVQCADCGASYSSLDRGCPSCGSGNCSYDTADARRWNSYADRRYRS